MLHFSDFFENPPKKLLTGSEVLLATYLDQHCKAYLGTDFGIEDISIDKRIHLKSSEMAFAISHGLTMKPECLEARKLADKNSQTNLSLTQFYANSVEMQDFASISNGEFVFKFESQIGHLTKFYENKIATAYVSLFAFVLVQSYIQKQKFRLVIDNSGLTPRDGMYNHLYILRDYGNKLLDDSNFSLAFNPVGMTCQLDFLAFRGYQSQRGYMRGETKPLSKFQVCSRLWQVGDAVLVYSKANANKKNVNHPITRCVIGVIRGYDKNGVTVEKYVNINTRLSLIHEVNEKMAIAGGKGAYTKGGKARSVYTEADKHRFDSFVSHYSWDSIGIDVATYNEGVFLLSVIQEDGTYQWFKNEEGQDVKLWLSTPDTVYAVLSDWGVKFNKERFIKAHFAPYGKTPVYDTLSPYLKRKNK